jgi:hypothetical protein
MNFEPLFERQIHPGIARAAQYFQDIAADRELPRRHDFRPTSVRSILGYIFLIEVLPGDYRFSLFGEHMSMLYGADLTNKRLSEIGGEELRGYLRKTYDAVVTARSFQYLRGRYAWPDWSVPIERLLVPMADDTAKLTTIFGLTIPDIPSDTLAINVRDGAAMLKIDTEYDSLLGAS